MVSLKDIAKACQVSVATVSKALNDHNDISAETKERIRQVAKDMGYFPNSAAKALKTNRTYNIGVLFVDEARSGLTHNYFSHVLDSFKQIAEQQGYDMTFINCCKTRPNRMTYLEHARYRGFDGVVIACIDFNDPEVIELVKSNIPVVTIDHLFHNRIAIMSDNAKGMEDLFSYVYERGHRKIAYIHGADSAVTQSRLSTGWRSKRAYPSRMLTSRKRHTATRMRHMKEPENFWHWRIDRPASYIRMISPVSAVSRQSDRLDSRSRRTFP